MNTVQAAHLNPRTVQRRGSGVLKPISIVSLTEMAIGNGGHSGYRIPFFQPPTFDLCRALLLPKRQVGRNSTDFLTDIYKMPHEHLFVHVGRGILQETSPPQITQNASPPSLIGTLSQKRGTRSHDRLEVTPLRPRSGPPPLLVTRKSPVHPKPPLTQIPPSPKSPPHPNPPPPPPPGFFGSLLVFQSEALAEITNLDARVKPLLRNQLLEALEERLRASCAGWGGWGFGMGGGVGVTGGVGVGEGGGDVELVLLRVPGKKAQ